MFAPGRFANYCNVEYQSRVRRPRNWVPTLGAAQQAQSPRSAHSAFLNERLAFDEQTIERLCFENGFERSEQVCESALYLGSPP